VRLVVAAAGCKLWVDQIGIFLSKVTVIKVFDGVNAAYFGRCLMESDGIRWNPMESA